MKKFVFVLFLIITLSLPTSLHASDIYRLKNMEAMSCSNPKLTAEVNYAIKHHQGYGKGTFNQLITPGWHYINEGQCVGYHDASGIQAAKQPLKIIRLEKLNTSIGFKTVAYCQIALKSYQKALGDFGFYLMADDIEKISYNSHFAIAAREEEARTNKQVKEMLSSSNDSGKCYFKIGAIFCTDAGNAAAFFKNFGFDMKRSYLSYNRQLLHDAGCAGTREPGHKAEVKGHLRIATPSGWVSIVGVSFDGIGSGNVDTFAYTAEDYLSGDCKLKTNP